jgi:hypothetical protein
MERCKMLERETAFYEANRQELRGKYAGKRVVIVGNSVLGVYNSDREAIVETAKTRPRGSFMVKYIPEDPRKERVRLSPLPRLNKGSCGKGAFYGVY